MRATSALGRMLNVEKINPLNVLILCRGGLVKKDKSGIGLVLVLSVSFAYAIVRMHNLFSLDLLIE